MEHRKEFGSDEPSKVVTLTNVTMKSTCHRLAYDDCKSLNIALANNFCSMPDKCEIAVIVLDCLAQRYFAALRFKEITTFFNNLLYLTNASNWSSQFYF